MNDKYKSTINIDKNHPFLYSPLSTTTENFSLLAMSPSIKTEFWRPSGFNAVLKVYVTQGKLPWIDKQEIPLKVKWFIEEGIAFL